MTVKLYVDWTKNRILTPKQFEEMLDKTIKERVTEEDAFLNYLEEYFTRVELFEMDKEEREKVRQDFQEYCEDVVYRELIGSRYSQYEEVMIELED